MPATVDHVTQAEQVAAVDEGGRAATRRAEPDFSLRPATSRCALLQPTSIAAAISSGSRLATRSVSPLRRSKFGALAVPNLSNVARVNLIRGQTQRDAAQRSLFASSWWRCLRRRPGRPAPPPGPADTASGTATRSRRSTSTRHASARRPDDGQPDPEPGRQVEGQPAPVPRLRPVAQQVPGHGRRRRPTGLGRGARPPRRRRRLRLVHSGTMQAALQRRPSRCARQTNRSA